MRASFFILFLFSALSAAGAQPDERGPLNDHTPSWLTLNAAARFRAEDYQGEDFQQDIRARFPAAALPLLERSAFQLLAERLRRAAIRPPSQRQESRSGVKDALDLRQAWVRFQIGHLSPRGIRQDLPPGRGRTFCTVFVDLPI
jgi:hypothetical protein